MKLEPTGVETQTRCGCFNPDAPATPNSVFECINKFIGMLFQPIKVWIPNHMYSSSSVHISWCESDLTGVYKTTTCARVDVC